jgi:hypothetical protein
VRLATLACSLAVLACAADAPSVERAGLEARIALDRSEARVGDRLGVTIEIDVPPGFEVQPPFLPTSAEFSTEAMEDVPAPSGTRRRVLLWTVRPRELGDLRLPELSIPFTNPRGELQQLVLAGLPLRVLSVRAELPAREAAFDIRPAPPLARDRAAWLFTALAVLTLAGVAGWIVRRRGGTRRIDPRALARESLSALADARAASPREAASRAALALRAFASRRWQLDLSAHHASELDEPIATPLRSALAALERARFARAPLADDVTASLESAAEYLSDVARG